MRHTAEPCATPQNHASHTNSLERMEQQAVDGRCWNFPFSNVNWYHTSAVVLSTKGAPTNQPRATPWVHTRHAYSPVGARQSATGNGVAPTGLHQSPILTQGVALGLVYFRAFGPQFTPSVSQNVMRGSISRFRSCVSRQRAVAMASSITCSSTPSGTLPVCRTRLWNSLIENFSPSACCALARSPRMLSMPIL